MEIHEHPVLDGNIGTIKKLEMNHLDFDFPLYNKA
jgi:hypothetical protein